ncbi:MAG TPA: hypothetical protein VF538_16790 [Pyrinomonadaceae bacterium]|jgi:hypothetical protein
MSNRAFGLVYSSEGIATAKEGWLLGEDVAKEEGWLEAIVKRERQNAYQEYVRKLAEVNARRLAEVAAVQAHARRIGEYALALQGEVEARAQEQAKAAERIAEVERKFRSLAEQWYLETMFSSAYLDKILHPAYQKILTLDKDVVVPLILRELQDMPNDWFWALRVITDEDPTSPEQAGDMEAMAQAWLEWGKENKYL